MVAPAEVVWPGCKPWAAGAVGAGVVGVDTVLPVWAMASAVVWPLAGRETCGWGRLEYACNSVFNLSIVADTVLMVWKRQNGALHIFLRTVRSNVYIAHFWHWGILVIEFPEFGALPWVTWTCPQLSYSFWSRTSLTAPENQIKLLLKVLVNTLLRYYR